MAKPPFDPNLPHEPSANMSTAGALEVPPVAETPPVPPIAQNAAPARDKPPFDPNQPYDEPQEDSSFSLAALGNGVVNAAKSIPKFAIDQLPTTTGIVAGVIASGALGPEAGIPMGMAVAGAMKPVKDILNNQFFGTPLPQNRSQLYGGMIGEALNTGSNIMGGEALGPLLTATGNLAAKSVVAGSEMLAGIPKAATELLMTPGVPEELKSLIKQSGGDLAVASNIVRTGIHDAVGSTVANLEKPVLELINNKATTDSAFEVGNDVKDLTTKNVTAKYGKFQEGYEGINQINRTQPIDIAKRDKFATSVTNWAEREFSNKSKWISSVNGYVEEFKGATNGAQFENVMQSLNDEITRSLEKGNASATNFGHQLIKLKGQASDFVENAINETGNKFARGEFSRSELHYLDTMKNNIPIENAPPAPIGYEDALAKTPQQMEAMKYGKSLSDALQSQKDAMKADYPGFKDFMGEVMGATKIRARGTANFLTKLENVPSETMLSNLMNPKNARALQMTAKELPEVFDRMSQFAVKNLVEKSAVEVTDAVGQVSKTIDTQKFGQVVSELPKEVRNLYFSPEEQLRIKAIEVNPQLREIKQLQKDLGDIIKPGASDAGAIKVGSKPSSQEILKLQRLGDLTGQNIVRNVKMLNVMENFGSQSASMKTAAGSAVVRKTSPVISALQNSSGGAPLDPYSKAASQAVGRNYRGPVKVPSGLAGGSQ